MIPVKISIDDLQGLNLVPGMNVTVKTHKKTQRGYHPRVTRRPP